MATIEDVLVHVGLLEIRARLQKTNEEIATLRGKWEEAIVKLQGFHSEIQNVQAQLQSTT